MNKDLVNIVLNINDTEFLITHLTTVVEQINRDLSLGYIGVPQQEQAKYLEVRRYELDKYQSLLRMITTFYEYRNKE